MSAMVNVITEESTSQFVQTNSFGEIHYNEAGSGHPLVLLHGSGPGATGWSNFRANISPLSTKHRVLAFDMPGWGLSSSVAAAGEYNHADALLEAMDALGIDKVAIVGNSMGGMTGQVFAARYPDRISHLIAMGAPAPGVNIFSPEAPTTGIEALLEAYADPSPASFKRMVQVMAYDPSFATDELAELRSRSAQQKPEHLQHFAASMPSLMEQLAEAGEKLSEFEVPTLILHGRDDRTVSMEHGLRLVALIPNSRLIVFNRCGHWVQTEFADEFNRLVEDFIANN